MRGEALANAWANFALKIADLNIAPNNIDQQKTKQLYNAYFSPAMLGHGYSPFDELDDKQKQGWTAAARAATDTSALSQATSNKLNKSQENSTEDEQFSLCRWQACRIA